MEQAYWLKQATDKPLFPELLWSRPESKRAAGKLLVIGGNLHGFAAPAEAYAEAVKAGVGTARVLLPDAVKKLIGPIMENGEFAPSTPSGSFSKQALAELLDHSAWADGVLLAGDFGRNSETSILLEQFADKHSGRLTLTRDAADYFKDTPALIMNRPDTTLVLSLAQLQKLCIGLKFTQAITFDMDILRLVEALHNLTAGHPASLIVKHLDTLFAAHAGQVSFTSLPEDLPIWRVKAAAHSAVWQLQNPAEAFEALTTSLLQTQNK
jgi:ADP-dependent NAD(P)H-hydrate dehydratase / NAD(P)H-hydrate epimerase